MIQLVESQLFEQFILLIILFNCIFMALYNPIREDDIRNRILNVSDYAFQGVFALEMLMKIFAYGFMLHPGSYLRDAWNILDFVVVTTGFLANFNLGNLSALRALRLLRPLRILSGLKEMRNVVNALLKSLPMLTNSFVLYFFVVLLYSIMGIQLYEGQFRWKCHNFLTNEIIDDDSLCAAPGSLNGRQCPDGYVCKQEAGNPYEGGLSFDNIYISLVTVFTCMTMEGWTNVLYLAVNSTGIIIPHIFFISMILFGSFFVINLFLAIITDNFDRGVQDERKELKESREREEIEKQRLLDEGLASLKIKESFQRKFVKKIDSAYEKVTTFIERKIPLHKRFRRVIKWIISTNLFSGIFVILTVGNTVALGLEFYGMPRWLRTSLTIGYYFFTSAFFVEFVLKCYGLGFKGYFRDPFNALDALIVLISLIDVSITGSSGFTVFRTLRLLRVVQLVRISSSLERLSKIFMNSLKGAMMLSLLLFLVIFIYALMGMQFFGGTFVEGSQEWMEDEKLQPRTNFDTFFNAMITAFLIIVSEDFQWMKYDGMMATNHWGALYYVSLYAIGNYVVLSLFIAILLSQFHAYDQDMEEESLQNVVTDVDEFKVHDFLLSVFCWWKKRKRKILHDSVVKSIHQSIPEHQDDTYRSIEEIATSVTKVTLVEHNEVFDLDDGMAYEQGKKSRTRFRYRLIDFLIGDYSLFIFPNNLFRKILLRIVNSKVFEGMIFFFIIASTVLLVLEDPFLPPDSELYKVISWLNLAITIVFALECIVKIMAMGFFFMNGAYLRNWWNVLDFFIVISAFGSMIMSDQVFLAFRALRLLRTLRPLRFIRRIAALRVVVDTLISSIPSIVNVILLSCVLYLLFGILGVNLIGGRLRKCYDHDGELNSPPWSNRKLCEENGGVWENGSVFHFDNLINAIITLYTIPIFEGFPTRLFEGMDTSDIDVAPRKFARPYIFLYYVSFVVIGAFFFTNLFVGVLIDHYSTSSHGNSILLTETQKRWIDIQKILLNNKPSYKPRSPKRDLCFIRKLLFKIVMHPLFEIFILTLIFLNIVVLSIQHYGQGATMSTILRIFNDIFTGFFVLEAILKLISFNPVGYFRDLWNVFDFAIVVLGLFGTVLSYNTSFVSFTAIFRIFRVARLFKVVQVAQGMRQLMKTLFLSIPSLLNVFGLLVLILFIYSVLGIRFFYNLHWEEPWDDGINEFANFRSLPIAMLTLFRLSTGEDWHEFLEDVMVTEPRCSSKLGTCGDPVIGALYWCTFMLLSYHIMVNLFVAFILDNFSSQMDHVNLHINEKSMNHYLSCWTKLDPDLTLLIKRENLIPFIMEIGEPLGIDTDRASYKKHIRILVDALDVIEYQGNVHYYDVLFKLARLKFGVNLPENVLVKMDQKWKRLLPKQKGSSSEETYTLKQLLAAIKVQTHWRRIIIQRKLSQQLNNILMLFKHYDMDDLSDVITNDSAEFDPDLASDSDDLSVDSIMTLLSARSTRSRSMSHSSQGSYSGQSSSRGSISARSADIEGLY